MSEGTESRMKSRIDSIVRLARKAALEDALAILDAMAERAEDNDTVVAYELRRAARKVRELG